MSGKNDGSTPLADIDADLNWIESLIAGLSPTDDYIEALIESNEALLRGEQRRLEVTKQEAAMSGSGTDTRTDEGGVFTFPEDGALPEDAIGTVTRDTQPNNTGPATFQLNGSTFYAIVKNDDREVMQAGDTVRVVDDGNKVSQRGAGAFGSIGGGGGLDESYFRYQGRLYRVPQVVTRDQDVKVSNQLYVEGDYESVEATLGPGEKKEVARIQPAPNAFFLLKYTNATNHPTVRYNYYIDGMSEPDEDLSGESPWATPPDLHEVIPGGWQMVEDYAVLEFEETSGNTEYDSIQGTLTGLEVEV